MPLDRSLEAAPFHLLTGEYPPQSGGVADYSALVASTLANSGVDVHVWTSTEAGKEVKNSRGVTVHRICGTWSRRDLARLGKAIDAFPSPCRLLVQYTPNVWGHRGLNLGFCRWLITRRDRGDDVRPMFHELWYEFDRHDKPTRWILPAVQRLMVRNVMAASTMAYASIPTWVDWLRPRWLGHGKRAKWLPVPSNIAVVNDPEAVAEIRRKLAPEGEVIVGSFGTYHGQIGAMLKETLGMLRSRPQIVLFGRGSDAFAKGLRLDAPLLGAGALSARDTSLYLQACDLFIQPYPDGLSSRRTSAMAALSHGRAVVSTLGYLTDAIWNGSGAVELSPFDNPTELASKVDRLIENEPARQQLGASGFAFYQAHFAIERVIETLRKSYEQ